MKHQVNTRSTNRVFADGSRACDCMTSYTACADLWQKFFSQLVS